MIRNILLFLFALFFISCSQQPKVVKPYEKAFEGEDTYIIFALRAEQLKDFKGASALFEKLYDKAGKKEYLYRSLQDALLAKENKEVITKVDTITQGSLDDAILIRLKVLALMGMGKLDSAKALAISLAKKTQKADDYLLAGDVFIKNQEFDQALKYLESAYAKEYNEKILDKMAVLLYANLDRKKDAIAYLETHTRVHGCSKRICSRLIGIYSNENNIEGLLSVYKRLYELDKNDKIAKKIIQIYAYKRDYVQLINFLEESGADDEVLLQLYSSGKNYKKAAKLAQKLYSDTGDITYLGQNAIYEYESYGKSISKEKLDDVIKKLKEVVEVSDDPLYLNYLGYILIDHSVDVKKGMEYVEKVLQNNPDSAYYIDSLAWGYYKLGKCKKAKELMNKVVKLEGGDNVEVLEHVQKIDECLKKSHKRKR
jgi:tetratricopeptide (TPR) repeat protein